MLSKRNWLTSVNEEMIIKAKNDFQTLPHGESVTLFDYLESSSEEPYNFPKDITNTRKHLQSLIDFLNTQKGTADKLLLESLFLFTKKLDDDINNVTDQLIIEPDAQTLKAKIEKLEEEKKFLQAKLVKAKKISAKKNTEMAGLSASYASLKAEKEEFQTNEDAWRTEAQSRLQEIRNLNKIINDLATKKQTEADSLKSELTALESRTNLKQEVLENRIAEIKDEKSTLETKHAKENSRHQKEKRVLWAATAALGVVSSILAVSLFKEKPSSTAKAPLLPKKSF